MEFHYQIWNFFTKYGISLPLSHSTFLNVWFLIPQDNEKDMAEDADMRALLKLRKFLTNNYWLTWMHNDKIMYINNNTRARCFTIAASFTKTVLNNVDF